MKQIKIKYFNWFYEKPIKNTRMEFEYYLPKNKITKELRNELIDFFKNEYSSLLETEICEATYKIYYGSKLLSNVYFVWKSKPAEIYLRFDEYGVGRSEFLVAGGVDEWDGYCTDVLHYLNKRRV